MYRFLCFHCHVIKNKNENQSIQRVQKLGNETEDKYSKSLAKNQVCAFYPNLQSFVRRRHVGGPLRGTIKYGRQKPTETSAFEFCYKCVNLLLEELIKIKVIFILRQLRNVKVAESPKIVKTFLTQRIAFQAARTKRTRHSKT